jgi:glycosyltransferase involved in cell wall biosynthesis
MGSFEPGGTERQMIELVRRLDRNRWDVRVACLRGHGTWFDRIAQAAPCRVFDVPSFKRVVALDRLREFAQWCRDERLALVHAVDTPANIFGLPGAALAGVPARIGARRDINPGRAASQLAAQRAAYGFAHTIVANARAAAERLRLERVPAERISIVHNGLDLAQFAPRRLSPPLRRVVTVANLRPEKGHDVLIAAAARVLRSFPDATFDFVGGGTEHAALQRLARDAGIARAVRFHGHVEDVAPHLASADIFVLPSRTEAFPNALLEALAAGLPSIASAVGGILEIIQDGRTGLLVPAGDSGALASRLELLMADGATGIEIGAAGRRDVASRFSFERMVAGFEQVYLNQLSRQGVVAAADVQLAAS